MPTRTSTSTSFTPRIRDASRTSASARCAAKRFSWNQIVRGYEHEKGQYVTIDDQELATLRPEATQAVEIQAFVNRDEIDPMLFDAPYYLQPEARGRRAYALLRDALVKTGKVGIAQVVLRTRAHLAALTPVGDALVVELLHYPHEVIPAKEVELPSGATKSKAAEMKAAEMLIDAMARPFDASEYKDDYEQKLRAALDARAKGHAVQRTKPKAPNATNVVDSRGGPETQPRETPCRTGRAPKYQESPLRGEDGLRSCRPSLPPTRLQSAESPHRGALVPPSHAPSTRSGGGTALEPTRGFLRRVPPPRRL